MRSLVFKRVLVLLVMICSTCPQGVCSTEQMGDYTFDKLPLFFVTDREVKIREKRNKYSYGKQLDRTGLRASEDEVGVNLTYGIENHKTRIPSELQNKGNWRGAFELEIFGNEHEPQGMKWRTFSGLIYGHLYPWQGREVFYEKVRNCLAKCPSEEIVLFIHGCCVDHKKASRQAINMQKWYRRPVILYDWGTRDKDYYHSLTAYPKTEKRFLHFMKDLKERFPNAKISVIAYSVGVNILKDYCLSVEDKKEKDFENVTILRADTGIGELETHLPAIVAHTRNKVQIWASGNDAQIKASRVLRTLKLLPHSVSFIKGPRAGESIAWVEKKHDRVQILDISKLNLGHDIPYRLLSLLTRSELKPIENGTYKVTKDADFESFAVEIN